MAPSVPDRTIGLVLFGVIQIAVGALLVLASALSLGGPLAPSDGGAVTLSLSSVLTNVSIAAGFVALGVGNVRRLRWARTLTMSISWLWLLTGILGVGMTIVMMPRIERMIAAAGGPEVPAAAMKIGLVIGGAFAVFGYVLLPAAFILYFRRPSVVAFVEREDPRLRWTDRVPVAVLGMILTLVYTAVLAVVCAPFGLVPLFGVMVKGLPAVLLSLAGAGVSAYLAWEFYRLRPIAWWATLVLSVAATLSAAVTFLRVDPIDLVAGAGLAQEQIEMIREAGLLDPGLVVGITLLSEVTILAYLAYLWPHFRRRRTP